MAKYTPRIDHSKKDYESESEDVAQDKKVAKKAIAMHDKQQHEGEKTDLSKLKHGGRAKKEVGTVRKYAAGGMPAAVAGKAMLGAGMKGTPASSPPTSINTKGIKGAFGLTGSGADRLANLQKPVLPPPPPPSRGGTPPSFKDAPGYRGKGAITAPTTATQKPYGMKKGGAVDNVDGKGGKSPGGKMGGLSAVPADKGAPHTAGVKKVVEKFNRGGKC